MGTSSGNETRKLGHAVVIGGSMAGLVCARVLSDHFEKVTIVDREARPSGPEPRKSVPQGRHAHALLEIIVRTLRDWFPGLIDEMTRDGAILADFCSDFAIYQYGGWKPRFRSDLRMLLCSRPFLEWHVRRRVEALPGVEIRYEHTAEGLILESGRVTGVRVKGPDGEQTMSGDLVIDAAGRGTRAPRWLAELGFDAPEEEAIEVDLAYTSRLYEFPDDADIDYVWLTLVARYPVSRGGFMYRVEGNRWLVSLAGYFGDHPPTDDEGFRAFAASLPIPDISSAIEKAKPVSEISQHKIPSSRWYHYEKVRNFPDGLLLLGDSVCCFNPVYGQGITLIIQCALELGARLSRLEGAEGLRGFSIAYQKKLASMLGTAWKLSGTLDLKFPQAKGKRSPGIGVMQWMFMNLFDLTSRNERAYRIFVEVLHVRRGPASFAHPNLLLPLLAYSATSAFIPFEKRINTGPRPLAP